GGGRRGGLGSGGGRGGGGAVGLAAAAGLAAASGFDGARAFRDVERLVAFGPRPAGTPALERTRGYITGELRRVGWRVREHAFTARTPSGPIRMVNLIAEWPGQRREVVAGGGDYDTKGFTSFRLVRGHDRGAVTAPPVRTG